MEPWKVAFIQITNTNPTFKGLSVIIAGLIALLFAYWMNKRWKEPLKGGFLVFIGLAVFIVLYGLFILVFQPHWWNPPY
jgi:putative flippase GtrA